MGTGGEAPAIITVTCNNLADPLIESIDGRFIRYPRAVMRKLVGEHGLSYHVSVGDQVIVFDTGGVLKTFMSNITHVEHDTARVSRIVLSHGHHDHVGGLVPFLAVRKELHHAPVAIHCHPLAVAPRFQVAAPGTATPPVDASAGTEALLRDGKLRAHAGVNGGSIERLGGRLVASREPATILDDDEAGIRVLTTGEIPRHIESDFLPKNYMIVDGDRLVHDTFLDDQAMIIEKKDEHAVVLLGCCHAGLENTLAAVRALTPLPVRVIAGGFHLSGATDATIDRKVAVLEQLGRDLDDESLCLRPTHCSGERFYLALVNAASSRLDVDRLPLGTRIIVDR